MQGCGCEPHEARRLPIGDKAYPLWRQKNHKTHRGLQEFARNRQKQTTGPCAARASQVQTEPSPYLPLRKELTGMKTMERRVAPSSDYFVYTPSKIAQKMFLYPLQCGLFLYQPGYRLSRSAFNSFLLLYLQKGTLQLTVEGKTVSVAENHFVLLDCYRPHGYATAEGCECIWLHFDGITARSYYEQITAHLGQVFAMADASPVLRGLNAILHTFSHNQPVREPLLSKIITDMLTEFLLYSPLTHSHAQLAENAITYINEHFSEKISLNSLADRFGMSTYHFIRVFKSETGYTPHDYIASRRMASARYLLQYTRLSIKDICYNTGFSTESVFCNAFKKQHGTSPQTYRRQGSEEAQAAAGRARKKQKETE